MDDKLDFRHTVQIRLLRALVEAYDSVMAQDAAEIRRHGLSQSEFDCLSWLGVAQPLRMCELAQNSLLTKSRVTQVMCQLQGKGLVKRERSPESDREVLATLTPEGYELFKRIYPAHCSHIEQVFNSYLSEKEQKDLTRLLRKLTDGNDVTGCIDE